jgi:hypothetical protein
MAQFIEFTERINGNCKFFPLIVLQSLAKQQHGGRREMQRQSLMLPCRRLQQMKFESKRNIVQTKARL